VPPLRLNRLRKKSSGTATPGCALRISTTNQHKQGVCAPLIRRSVWAKVNGYWAVTRPFYALGSDSPHWLFKTEI
jgi:hypothetical protein